MQDELSNIINRQIDLRTAADLSRYFRRAALARLIEIIGEAANNISELCQAKYFKIPSHSSVYLGS